MYSLQQLPLGQPDRTIMPTMKTSIYHMPGYTFYSALH